MARTRLLSPGFFTNEILAEMPPHARLLFAGLWLIADREGLLEDRPRRIAREIFPYEPNIDVGELLRLLEVGGFIRRYRGELDGEVIGVIHVVKFLTHQQPHVRETKSRFDRVLQNQGAPEAAPGFARGEPKASPRLAQGEPRSPVSVLVPLSDPVPVSETVSERKGERRRSRVAAGATTGAPEGIVS